MTPVQGSAGQLLATNFGSPPGITSQDSNVRFLWNLTYWLAIPLGLLVIGLVLWCVVRYRQRPGRQGLPRQFQYHIPIEAAYTIIPLVMVAVVFGFVFKAESNIDAVAKNPSAEVRVEGFQWGWRFTYMRVGGKALAAPQRFEEVGSVANEPSLNDDSALPVLTLPANVTVQLDLFSDDVNHSFYIPATLFKRDLIQGVSNTVDMNFVKTGQFIGECTQFCGTFHPYMRFVVNVVPPAQFVQWAGAQVPGSVTYAGKPINPGIAPNIFGAGN
ncbi:MAG: cytochrome c oxidase subunit II [Acidimicrobiales bacterium]